MGDVCIGDVIGDAMSDAMNAIIGDCDLIAFRERNELRN